MDSDSDSCSYSSSPSFDSSASSAASSPTYSPTSSSPLSSPPPSISLDSRFVVELPCKKEMTFLQELHRHAYGFDYKACLRHLSYNRGFVQSSSRHLTSSRSSRCLGGRQKLDAGRLFLSKSGKF